MIQASDNTLAVIVEVAHSVLPGAQVLLFGSHARGQAGPQSDYDILIITDQPLEMKAKFTLRTQIRKLLLDRGIRSDVLLQSREEVRRKKELPGHVIRNALREAVPL